MAARYATVQEVLDLPGISDPEATDAVTLWLPITQHMISLCAWGERASDGHRLLTAHYVLATAGPTGSGVASPDGIVSAEANGPASRSFAVAAPPAEDADLASTSFGRAYIALRKTVAGRGRAVVLNPLIRQRC